MTSPNDYMVERQTRTLLEGSPFSEWPGGMPASIDPELVFIGVSPGNSPMPEDAASGQAVLQAPRFISAPTVRKPSNSHFYYPDSSKYWEKLRYLAHQYFLQKNEAITENAAISRCSHFNLGTGDAGSATKNDVEEDVVKWVSRLLDRIHKPEIVILFGLNGILKDDTISSWWNHSKGLTVPWSTPHEERRLMSYQGRNYRFREWRVTASNGNEIKLVIWPNHPSRPPFRNAEIWQRAVREYLHEA